MIKKLIRQGEIYYCDLSIDAIENETTSKHPVLIASMDLRNDTSPNVFVFPITHSTTKKLQPTHYALYKADYPSFKFDVNTVLCEEGRSISKTRLENKMLKISKEDLENILKCNDYVFKKKT